MQKLVVCEFKINFIRSWFYFSRLSVNGYTFTNTKEIMVNCSFLSKILTPRHAISSPQLQNAAKTFFQLSIKIRLKLRYKSSMQIKRENVTSFTGSPLARKTVFLYSPLYNISLLGTEYTILILNFTAIITGSK